MKQEQTFPTTSTSFTKDIWEGEGPLENVKDVDNLLENVLDSKNTEEDPSNMTALGGDEEDEVGEHNTNGSEPDDKKKSDDPPSRQRILKSSQEKFIRKRGRPRKVAKQSFDGEEECVNVGEDPGWNYENKTKHFSDMNVKEIHSNDVGSSGDTLESESVGLSVKSESISSSKESGKCDRVGSSRKRGKDLDWLQVERFENPEAFERSQIKVELDTKMSKRRAWESMGARNAAYACNVYRKQGWKSCPRKYRVSLLSTAISPCH